MADLQLHLPAAFDGEWRVCARRERSCYKVGGSRSSWCLGYPCPTDDDSGVVAGCSSTGAADRGEVASRMWMQAAGKRGAHVTPLPPSWVTAHLVQLAVALLVRSETLWEV